MSFWEAQQCHFERQGEFFTILENHCYIFLFPFPTTRGILSINTTSRNSGMRFITVNSKNFDKSSNRPYICARCWYKVSNLVFIMHFFINFRLREVLISMLALTSNRKRVVTCVNNRVRTTQSSMSFWEACHSGGHPPVHVQLCSMSDLWSLDLNSHAWSNQLSD